VHQSISKNVLDKHQVEAFHHDCRRKKMNSKKDRTANVDCSSSTEHVGLWQYMIAHTPVPEREEMTSLIGGTVIQINQVSTTAQPYQSRNTSV
jgi:hypothetical protein